MRLHARKLTALLVAALCLSLGQAAWASAGIGASNADGPKTFTEHDFKWLQLGWKIGSSKNRVPVAYDDSKGAWVKQLELPLVRNTNNGTDGLLNNELGTNNENGLGFKLSLKEYLVIDGEQGWIDWHEKIVDGTIGNGSNGSGNAGLFSWDDEYTFKVKKPGDSGFSTPSGLTADFSDGIVDFTFDELPVGTEVFIEKHLEYEFLNGYAPLGSNNGATLNVAQYPTVPTPSTAVAGLALLGGLVLRRRRHVA